MNLPFDNSNLDQMEDKLYLDELSDERLLAVYESFVGLEWMDNFNNRSGSRSAEEMVASKKIVIEKILNRMKGEKK